jgi:hypothetical protein
MVYHYPAADKWFNSRALGPLRLLVSDQRAAQVLREPLVNLAQCGVVTFSAAYLAASFLAAGGDDQQLMVAADVCAWPADADATVATAAAATAAALQQPEQASAVAVAAAAAVALTVLLAVAKYFAAMYAEWSEHARHVPLPADQASFFFVSDEAGNAPPEALRDGVRGQIFDRARRAWRIWPYITLEGILARSVAVVGLRFAAFVWAKLTIGVEYTLTAAARGVLHYCNWPGFDQRGDRKQLYTAAVNTTMACFIRGGEPGAPSYGNVVVANVTLPYRDATTRLYDVIEFGLDHKTEEMTFVRAVWTGFDGKKNEAVVGDRDAGRNSFADLDEAEQVHQMGLMLVVVVALSLHGVTHHWANGTCLVSNDEWASAELSTTVTSFMNFLATFGSAASTGWSVEQTGHVLGSNAANGFPFHTSVPTKVIDRSVFHKMAFAAKMDIVELLQETRVGFNFPKSDSIVAGTIQHAYEHYAVGAHAPVFSDSNNVILETDQSGLMFLCVPIAYWSFNSLVRQHLHCPVNRALYAAACKYDRFFADNYLALGTAV